MTKTRPYIGITDFMNGFQAQAMLDIQRSLQTAKWQRRLQVGVMMSWKTLHDQPTKWADAFPRKETVAGIFLDDADAFNVLHYADYDGHPLRENLEQVLTHCGPNLGGLQLDMIWPDPAELKRFRQDHPALEIIVQGNRRAMDQVGHDPLAFADRLAEYGDAADYVLLDKSGGQGKGMDAVALLPFAEAVADRVPGLRLAAAGGLGPETLHLADPLVARFPDISLDAQGKLRPSGNALDPIDWPMAAAYLTGAAKRFG